MRFTPTMQFQEVSNKCQAISAVQGYEGPRRQVAYLCEHHQDYDVTCLSVFMTPTVGDDAAICQVGRIDFKERRFIADHGNHPEPVFQTLKDQAERLGNLVSQVGYEILDRETLLNVFKEAVFNVLDQAVDAESAVAA